MTMTSRWAMCSHTMDLRCLPLLPRCQALPEDDTLHAEQKSPLIMDGWCRRRRRQKRSLDSLSRLSCRAARSIRMVSAAWPPTPPTAASSLSSLSLSPFFSLCMCAVAFYFVHWLTDLAGAVPKPLEGSEKFVLKFPHPVLGSFIRSFGVINQLAHDTETKVFESYLVQTWQNELPTACGPVPSNPSTAIALMRLAIQARRPTSSVDSGRVWQVAAGGSEGIRG